MTKKQKIVLGVVAAVAVSVGVVTVLLVTKETWKDRKPEIKAQLMTFANKNGVPSLVASPIVDCISQKVIDFAETAKCKLDSAKTADYLLVECEKTNPELQAKIVDAIITCSLNGK